MRLRDLQVQTIRRLVRAYAGRDCRVYLFGSRMDDKARGGDVDLVVETPEPLPRRQRARLKMALESQLELPTDLVFRAGNRPPSAFERIAMDNAKPLDQLEAR